MDSEPSLSVVVPVYNEADQLAHCLESLLLQAKDINEIIVVDNNSTDGSLELARDYASLYAKIAVREERCQGLVSARNNGFLAVKSSVVARIDADTRVEPGWALAITEHFINNPEVAAITGETHYYDLPLEKLTAKISAFIVGNCNRVVSGFPSLYGPNMALRADIAKQLASEACDGSTINEDLDLTIHLVSGNQPISYAPKMLASISGRRMKSNPANFYRYCLNWPRTFLRHRQRMAAVKAAILATIFCLGQALIFLPLRAYDHESYQFSWRYMRQYGEDRIIP